MSNKTVKLHYFLEMKRKNDTATFDYKISVEDGKIMFIPDDPQCAFTTIYPFTSTYDFNTIEKNNRKHFCVCLVADMSSDSDNFDYYAEIDEMGNANIIPDSDDTTFISVIEDDSLNLITEDIDENLPKSKYLELVKQSGVGRNNTSYIKYNVIPENELVTVRLITPFVVFDGTPVAINAEDCYVSWGLPDRISNDDDVAEFIDRLQDAQEFKQVIKDYIKKHPLVVEKPTARKDVKLEESKTLSDEEKLAIIDRFQKGEITILEDNSETPAQNLIHLPELTSKSHSDTFDYYYDPESDAVVYYRFEGNDSDD